MALLDPCLCIRKSRNTSQNRTLFLGLWDDTSDLQVVAICATGLLLTSRVHYVKDQAEHSALGLRPVLQLAPVQHSRRNYVDD